MEGMLMDGEEIFVFTFSGLCACVLLALVVISQAHGARW